MVITLTHAWRRNVSDPLAFTPEPEILNSISNARISPLEHVRITPAGYPQSVIDLTPDDQFPFTLTGAGRKKEKKSILRGGRLSHKYLRLSPTIPAESVLPSHPEEEDDLSVAIAPGTQCRHKGCRVAFASDAENRIGNGEGTVCTYHPAPPVFHEGSKGYLCCKRRVLEFEEFLKIEGCKKGRHVFVSKQSEELAEQFMECRVDHYQTPNEVHVSVFAKQADKERSEVTVEETQVHFDLYLPAQKRFKRTIQLFGPVEPEGSSYKFFGTKVEVVLKKLDTRSWTVLEKTTRDLGNINLTFGVGGRTGTIGGKEIILDEQSRNRAF
ncbi:HSP20-like chaperone [Lanmaoa asiatica]|nr:HSP20-like chaperone [Lanmaoa asiatica]